MDMAGEARAVAYLGHGKEKACFEKLELDEKWLV